MAERISINAAEIDAVASDLRSINNTMDSLLKQTQSKLNSLGNSWSGQAFNNTNEAYNTFARSYFSKYQQNIEAYALYLNRVAEMERETESANIQNASAFN